MKVKSTKLQRYLRSQNYLKPTKDEFFNVFVIRGNFILPKLTNIVIRCKKGRVFEDFPFMKLVAPYFQSRWLDQDNLFYHMLEKRVKILSHPYLLITTNNYKRTEAIKGHIVSMGVKESIYRFFEKN